MRMTFIRGLCAATLLGVFASAPAWAQTITSFEGFAIPNNGNVMFRAPNFSGSTSAFLDTTLSANNQAAISNVRANTGTQSMNVSFLFRPAQTNPFLRLTTSGATNLPNPAIDLSLALQLAIFVPASTPDFYLSLGVRETGNVVAIGANGGGMGTIEFVGATALQGGSPIGRLITTKNSWVNLVFNLPLEPVRAFTGNGVLNGSFGVLESLNITPTSNANVGPYSFFLDDIRQTPLVLAATPEPSALVLLALGIVPVAGLVARRRQS